MKITNISRFVIMLLALVNLASCGKDDTDLYSGDYILRSQAEVDAFNI